jgi:hypothetical protein
VLKGVHLLHQLKLTNMGGTPATVLSFELEHSTFGTEGINGPRGVLIKDIKNDNFDRVLGPGESIQDTPIDIFQFIKSGPDDFVGFHCRITYRHVFGDDAEEVLLDYTYVPFSQQLAKVPQPKTGGVKS